jgi:hypothetical protein
MKKIIFLFILTIVGASSIKLNAQTNEVKHKVVIQLNTADTAAWSSTKRNESHIRIYKMVR